MNLNCTPIVRHNLTNWRCSFSMAKFSAEEKLQAVARYLNGNESYRTIGKSIGVNHKAIQKWVKQFEHITV